MAGLGGAVGGSFAVVGELNREWESLREDSREVPGWRHRHQAIAGCQSLHDVLTAVWHDPDAVLGALLWEARSGSTAAARTVLQAMLGKVVLLARATPTVEVDAYLFAMWECIRTYPIERRPRHVAANLALDTRKLARRELGGSPNTIPWPLGASFADAVDRQRARDTADHAADLAVLTAGDVIRAALELELIDAAAGELLGTVYSEGLTSAQAADRHATSAAMVRQRCSRAVRQLAAHSAEIASYA